MRPPPVPDKSSNGTGVARTRMTREISPSHSSRGSLRAGARLSRSSSPPAATMVTFTWTMSDDVFINAYLHVWANVTIGNETIPLVVDQTGVTSVTWTTRDIVATDVIFRVDVQDPFGAHATAFTTFSLTRQSPIALIAAILIAVVLIVFVVFGYRRARKHEEASPSPPPAKPPAAPAAPLPIAP